MNKKEKVVLTTNQLMNQPTNQPFHQFTLPASLAAQNKDEGGDYGHHMSRAACNMAGGLLSEELKAKGVAVVMLHPGFNRTEMTKKYEHIWDIEGAVDKSEGAMRVLYEVGMVTMDTTGRFVNCEDGLQIPF